MNQIVENRNLLKRQIDLVACEYGRDANDIHVIAVSKQQPNDRIEAALNAGQRLFGENRVQEALDRWATRRTQYPDLQLHLIGSLQTNKVGAAVALFDVIETVDRIKLADALKAEMLKQGRNLSCFIQINTGHEDQKAGVPPEEFPTLLDHCRAIGLNIIGLMCIPPVNDPPALHFALLRKIAATAKLENLSMGMSADFEKALPLGATHIRIGTAFFGERKSL